MFVCFGCETSGILASQTWTEATHTLHRKARFNHWTTREVPLTALICISLMITNTELPFMHLLAYTLQRNDWVLLPSLDWVVWVFGCCILGILYIIWILTYQLHDLPIIWLLIPYQIRDLQIVFHSVIKLSTLLIVAFGGTIYTFLI